MLVFVKFVTRCIRITIVLILCCVSLCHFFLFFWVYYDCQYVLCEVFNISLMLIIVINRRPIRSKLRITMSIFLSFVLRFLTQWCSSFMSKEATSATIRSIYNRRLVSERQFLFCSFAQFVLLLGMLWFDLPSRREWSNCLENVGAITSVCVCGINSSIVERHMVVLTQRSVLGYNMRIAAQVICWWDHACMVQQTWCRRLQCKLLLCHWRVVKPL